MKGEHMADHKVDVCNDWNGAQGDKVTFINNTQMPCKIDREHGTTWPFNEGPPLPTIAAGASIDAHLDKQLKDGKYPYSVSCCKDRVPKVVTVP
jgi:hypothetical protein